LGRALDVARANSTTAGNQCQLSGGVQVNSGPHKHDPARRSDGDHYHLLGVDPRLEIRDRLGRRLTLCEGNLIEGIL